MLFHAPPVSHLESSLRGIRAWVKLLPSSRPQHSRPPLASADLLKALAVQQTLCGSMSNFSHAYLPIKSSSFSKDWFSIFNVHSRGCLPKTTKCGSRPIEASISIHCHEWAPFLSLQMSKRTNSILGLKFSFAKCFLKSQPPTVVMKKNQSLAPLK